MRLDKVSQMIPKVSSDSWVGNIIITDKEYAEGTDLGRNMNSFMDHIGCVQNVMLGKIKPKI